MGVGDEALVPAPLATAFSLYAAPFAVVTRFGTAGIPSLQKVPFDTRAIASDALALSASFAWVRAGHAKPAISGTIGPAQTLRRSKVRNVP